MCDLSPRPRNAVLSAAISGLLAQAALCGGKASAAESEEPTQIIVTATRRAESVQDVPINIAAVSGETIAAQGIGNLTELAKTVPGLYIRDQGGRGSNQIVVRGLNADPVAASEAISNNGGGTVATYVGEIPLYVDLALEDIERVEVLLGPQGTLYGAGTLGGAVRYIPRRPQFDTTSLELRASGYSLAESDGYGAKGGFTFNVPLGEALAFRATLDYEDDPGFIDYPFLVRTPGGSDPEPDFSDPQDVATNLWSKKDVDSLETLAGRAALRWMPTDALDLNLTYYYQQQDSGGRTINNLASFNTGRYESGMRYLEPNDRTNQLLALELTADLGFAELTSASGYSRYDEKGQRDQTDLLITLQLSYEQFPTFSSFTLEDIKEETLNQELRLVSKSDGPLQWIVGAFYNEFDYEGVSMEFTPGFDLWAIESWGLSGVPRPDALEYYNPGVEEQKEKALYGELSYHFTDRWQVTVGARYYDYDLRTESFATTPLWLTISGEIGPNDLGLPDEIPVHRQSDSGSLFKFNTSYDFTDSVMGYFTISEGYRIGAANGIEACEDPLPPGQNICAMLPGHSENTTGVNEFSYEPDRTVNYELGLRTEWLGGNLLLNGAVYYIDWQDPQLLSSTANGNQPITLNGNGAESRGFELNVDARLTDRLSFVASYAYTQAELTDVAPRLNRTIMPGGGFDNAFVDGQKGDRLPGSPEHQGYAFVRYGMPLGTMDLDLSYGISAISNVLTRAEERGDGEAMPGYAVHSASASLRADAWTVTLYANNLLNKYAVTGVRSNRAFAQTVADENGEPVTVRAYSHYVLRPREVGLRLTYDFDL